MRLASLLACASVVFSTFSFGQSGFTEKITPFSGYTGAMLPFDFNRDGHTDLLMPGSPQITVAVNDGAGTFSKQIVTITPGDSAGNAGIGPVAIADFDGDGYPDVAACSSRNNGNFLEVFKNEGGVSLSLMQTIQLKEQCVGIAAVDVNSDGKWDVVVGEVNVGSNNGSSLVVFLGNGSYSFTQLPAQIFTLTDPQQPTASCALASLAAADFQRVGRYDLVMTANCIPTNYPFTYGSVYYGKSNGKGTFALSFLSETLGPGGMQLLDVNHDLAPDLLLTLANNGVDGSFGSNATILRNLGNQQFALEVAEGANTSDGCGTILFTAAAGDLNGDGLADVAGDFTNNGDNCTEDLYYLQLVKGTSSNTYSSWQQWNESQAVAMAIADVNNDNRNDILVDINGMEIDTYINTQTFAPKTSCKAKGPGTTVCAPLADSTQTSSVNFQAVGVGVTGPVRLMEVWVDGKKMDTSPGNLLNKTLTLPAGTHSATVVQLEYNGQSFRSAKRTFTVN